jgi:Uncharacterised nucleotidyltransferase
VNSATFHRPDVESDLSLRCCAVYGTFADRRRMPELVESGVDWNRFLMLANRNSVTPMVGARLGAEGAANLPRQVARALRLSYEVNALRSHHLTGCAVEIVDSFGAAGVPLIAIKGPALAIAAYGDVAMRVFGDLDFMVRLEDLTRATAALERVGYSSRAYHGDGIESGFFPDVALDFARPDSVVDLHWRLSHGYFPFAPAGEQLFNRTAEIEILGPTRSGAWSRRFDFVSGLPRLQARLDDTRSDLRLCPRARHRSDRELPRPSRRRAARGQPADVAAQRGARATRSTCARCSRIARRRPPQVDGCVFGK